MLLYTVKKTRCSNNDMLHNTVRQIIPITASCATGYVDLHHVRNLYIISNTAGAHNSMISNGEWGILKKIPVSVVY